jgi:hypothetical protein
MRESSKAECVLVCGRSRLELEPKPPPKLWPHLAIREKENFFRLRGPVRGVSVAHQLKVGCLPFTNGRPQNFTDIIFKTRQGTGFNSPKERLWVLTGWGICGPGHWLLAKL